MTELPFYLCLAGPTASGKTAAALAIAEALAGVRNNEVGGSGTRPLRSSCG